MKCENIQPSRQLISVINMFENPLTLSEDERKNMNDFGIRPMPIRVLDPNGHVYRDPKTGEVDSRTEGKSVTYFTQGEMTSDKQARFQKNADGGSTLHKIREGLVRGEKIDYDSLPMKFVPGPEGDRVKAWFEKEQTDDIAQITSDGSVILPEVIVTDEGSGISGSIDSLIVSPKGWTRIDDLKTSENQMFNVDGTLSSTQQSKWIQGEGSVFNNYLGDKSGSPVLTEDGKLMLRTSEEQPVVKLSKELGHNTQVGSYAKIMELHGVPVVGARIRPYLIDYQQNESGEWMIKNIRRDNKEWRDVDLNENQPYIDAVIPTEIDENHPSKLQENRPGYDYVKEPEYEDPIGAEELKKQSQKQFNAALDNSDVAKNIATEIVKIVGQREQYIRNLNRTKQEPAIQQKTIHALQEMKQDMMRSLNKGKYSTILNDWMDYTIRQSTITSTYLSDPDNLSSDRFTSIAEQSRKFIQSYAYINGLIDQVHSTQISKFNEAVGAVNNLRKTMEDSLRDWAEYRFKGMDTKYLDQEIQEYVNGNPEDIGIFTRLVGAPSTTASIPVSLAFKTISDAVYRTTEAWNTFKDNVRESEKVLFKALGIRKYKDNMYERMTHPDGTFVMRENPVQLQRESDAWKKLQDDNGERRQFILGTTKEDIVHNKTLQSDIAAYNRLTKPEQYNGDPGEYYEYKPMALYDNDGNVTGHDDFVAKRDEFETQDEFGKWHILFTPDAVEGLKWTKHDGKYYEETPDGTRGRLLSDNERKGLAALEYRNKYYTPHPKEFKLEYKDGQFTGKVTKLENEYTWSVKPQYKSLRDHSLVWDDKKQAYVTDRDLRDPKYVAMMDDTSTEGRVWWQFYNQYMDNMNKLMLKLPAEKREYLKGKIPAQSSSLFTQLMDNAVPQTTMALLGNSIRNMFSSTYVGERQVDEAGNIRHSIPTGYTGSGKDQEKIDKLKKQIELLDAEWNNNKSTATKAEKVKYQKDRKLLSEELKTEESRLMPYQIEKDLVKAQIDLAYKIEAFDQMSAVESDVLMIRELAALKVEKGELAKTDANGRSLFKRTLNEIGTSIKRVLTGGGANSNELQRIDDILNMLLYKSEEYPGSFLAKLEQLPITLSAINMFLINPPVSIGVHFMMNSIHAKEGLVGQFFNMKQLAKSKKEVNLAIPAYISNSAIKSAGGEGKKFASKAEAWMDKTQAFTKGISDDSGGLKDLLKLEHYVEWTGVATGAIAIGFNTKIKGLDGTISNCYDVWHSQPDGTIVIDPNYIDAWEKQKYSLNRTMADYQNRFHGAYAPIERAAVTQYPGGKSSMFLHKWIPASILNMLTPRQVHSNLGVTEGQMITLYNFVKDLKDYQGNVMEKFQQGFRDMAPKGSIGNPEWDKLSPEEQDAADQKAYENDPKFRKADGSFDQKKADRDRDTRKLELANMKRNLVTLVYLMVATAVFLLFKSIAEDAESDDTRRWSNFLAKTFDRLRRQQLFAVPVVGLEEQYSLLKSPIASLRTMGEFAEAFSATFGLVVPPYGANYYTTGVHKGELKATVAWERVTPGLNLIRWYKEQNNPSYWIK